VDAYRAWLGDDGASPPELLALLKSCPLDAMRAYPVRTVVNSPKNDTPECIEPTT
jgi:putative SOS response-associated peptidase YedK